MLTPEQSPIVAGIAKRLVELGISCRFTEPISEGPIVSVYRFVPTAATAVVNMTRLGDDIAIALGVEDVVIKRMPGENAVSFFVPRRDRRLVSYLDTVTNVWKATHGEAPNEDMLPLNLGVDYLGRPAVENLASLPHLLIAGSTGSGKSTLVSSILASLIYCTSPTQIQLVLSDTKGVEFHRFNSAPHLMFPVARDVATTLEYFDLVLETMEKRLAQIGRAQLQNIGQYRAKIGPMNWIVLVIDELADLLLDETKPEITDENGETKMGKAFGKQAQYKLSKIVQKSRAAGIHVIAGTQRPSVDVVKGSIKANFPARLTFRLPSQADSTTIIGTEGAEHLLSRGDMLYLSPNKPGIQRLHAPFTKLEEIDAAVEAACARSATR